MSAMGLLVSYIVNAAWQALVIAAAGWLAARVLQRISPRAEHIGWIVTLITAVLVPAVPFMRSLPALLYGQSSAGGHLILDFSDSYAAAPIHGAYRWPDAAIWLLIALYFVMLIHSAGRMIWSFDCVRSMIRKAGPQPLNSAQQEIWDRCQQAFQLRHARLLCSPQIAGPVAAGLRKPVLIVPAGFVSRCTEPDILAALGHECAHARRRDFQKNLCYEALSLSLAFHPAIWFIKARIAQTREMICDRMVAETLLEPRSYAQSLLRLAGMISVAPRIASIHAIGIFDANILEERIMMMNRKRSYAGRIVRLSFTLFAILLLAAAGAVAGAKSIAIEPQQALAAQPGRQPKNADPYGHIYKIGNGVTAPVPIFVQPAKFSDEARRAKYQGVVLISLIVDAHGDPQNARVIRPLGKGLDEKALEAVRKYKFKPAMKDGKTPVPVMVNLEVNFKLY